jgi:bifunctional oligoribonuclease and PAP phosphatase NrnA
MSSLATFATDLDHKLKNIHHITLISHRTPDGDAFGSLEGMRGLIAKNHSHLTIEVVVPEEQIDTHIAWILGNTVHQISASTDLILLLDTSLVGRTKVDSEAFSGHTILSIDHHEQFPEAIPGYRDSTASSNTIILTEMAEMLWWTIDAPTATALLMGIYTDTWGFIHRNTDARALSVAARLLDCGGDQSAIAQRVFGSYSLDYLHQIGRGLLAIEVVDNVAILCLQPDIQWWLKSHIIGYLSGLENVDIACVLYPEEGGIIKGSLRTRYDTIDVNQIAHQFGWGGHKKASGFRIPWNIIDGIIHFEGKIFTAREFVRNFIQK